MFFRAIIFFCLLLFSGFSNLAFAEDYTIGNIRVVEPWAREMAPTAKAGAGYFLLINNGDQGDRLVAVESGIASRLEIHEMRMENNVMKMRQLVDGLEILPHSSNILQPGGNHIMFFEVEKPFREGESFKAILVFEKAGKVEINFPVRKIEDKK